MTDSYFVSKMSHVSHHTIFITVHRVCSKCPLQHERKRADAEATRHQHI